MATSDRLPRRNSLRLPPQPPPIRIPPSLKQSPYLAAPIFNREVSTPIMPSEEDEKWLQDTVPIPSPNSPSSTINIQQEEALERRASFMQSSTHLSRFAVPSAQFSGPPSPGWDSPPSTPSSPANRNRSRTRYLAHSLLPSAERPSMSHATEKTIRLKQAVSEPNITQPFHCSQEYFSGVSPVE